MRCVEGRRGGKLVVSCCGVEVMVGGLSTRWLQEWDEARRTRI